MDNLQKMNFSDLKKMALKMGLESKRSKQELLISVENAFKEYERYKAKKVDKYTKMHQIGNKGKEGVVYKVKNLDNVEFAMKTFKKTKSSDTLKLEYTLQKQASSVGISPRVVEYDSISKYIVMETMDNHLSDMMVKQKGNLTKAQQQRIIEIYQKLDDVGVFHGDSNIMNYMLKNKIIYIIDFGFSKPVDSKLIKKLGTSKPNIKYMTLGFIIKLKEMNCPSTAWNYLKKYLSDEDIEKFKIE
jgi:predicted Ser/Thr protein kinase